MTHPLTRHDITVAAREVGCNPAAIKAVVEIEAASSGFDNRGRPRILFEPHIFERELNALGYSDYGEIVQRARRDGLASPTWNRRLYPKTQDGRWDQLNRAREIDDTAALKSASYGLGQVMGFNHKLCDYNSVQDLVAAMHESEGTQLMAMIKFISSAGLADELRNREWGRFARGYNGPAYAKNRYHIRLNDAYLKHEADSELFWRGRPTVARKPEPPPLPTKRDDENKGWIGDAFGWT